MERGGRQLLRLGQEAKSSLILGAIAGHQSNRTYRISLNSLRDLS